MKKKKILSWLLVLAMCLTLIPAAAVPVAAAESHSGHCVCGASSCTAEDSYHQHSTPTSWTGITSLDSIKGDGAYYLGTNITLSQTWTCNYNVVLCLNGKTISCTGDATVIELTSGHTLQITDCHKGSTVGTITGNNTGNKRGIISYGTLYLWNGNITGNKAGGVAVNGSQFYMYGGKISNNSTEADPGAGVYVGCANSSVGVFRMYGGEISGNSSNNLNGGGVYVSSSASFYLEGGSILHNTAAKGGGGVFTSGTFAMSDSAEVSYNTAVSEGGGVYNNNDGKFTMTGGKITNNIAATGGGVYLGINDQGVMTLSGKARIAGNKAGNANSNLYLPSGKTVIAKDLTAGAGIGVSTQADLVEGNVLVTSDAVSANYFTSDNTTYETKLTEGTTSANRVILTQRSLYETKHEHSCVCGATHSGTIGDHDTAADLTNWVGVSDLNMITGAGNYYLLDSVTLTEAVAVRDLPERSGTTYCGWDVPDDVVLCLNGHNITMHNPEGQNNVDVIHVTGEFTLTDCTSTQGRITHTSGEVGRGLEVQGGTFNMYGGQITGNRTPEYGTGGGVHVEGIMDTTKTSVFNLYKGSISGNTSGYGGGVYVNRNVDNGLSQFNMYGGSISNNTCTVSNDTSSYGVGGGVNVSWTAAFKMTGGSITGNTAKFGGAGVYLSALARSSQSDSGEQRTAKFEVSGSLNITGNKTNSAENNVYLDTSTDSYWVGDDVPRKVETVKSSITILEGLSDDARIGVTTGATPTAGNRVLVATDSVNGKNYKSIFTSDVSGYEVQNLENTTLMLAVTGDTKPEPDHVHNWTYALKTGTTDTIVAKCDVAGCSSPNGGSVQILKPTQLKPN